MERVSIPLHPWPMLFGRYSAGNSIFWQIFVRKEFCWSQKIQKNRFFQNRFKSQIYVYSASKTCLGTPKGHFLAIYTYISHYLTLYKKSNFWKKSRFFRILAIFDKSNFGRSAGRVSLKWPQTAKPLRGQALLELALMIPTPSYENFPTFHWFLEHFCRSRCLGVLG